MEEVEVNGSHVEADTSGSMEVNWTIFHELPLWKWIPLPRKLVEV